MSDTESTRTMSTAPICTAHKSSTNEPCKAYAIRGGTVCVYHGGKAPQVREAAQRRLLEMADPALAALVAIVEQPLNGFTATTKLNAAKDILDRIGMGATQKHEHNVNVFDTRDQIMEAAREILNQQNENELTSES